MDDPDAPVVVRGGLHWGEAQVMRGLLESAGIDCEIIPATDPGVWVGRGTPPRVRLVVHRRDLADATAALEG